MRTPHRRQEKDLTFMTQKQANERFIFHLNNILPNYSVSHSGKRNQTIQYCRKVLDNLGRDCIIDAKLNIVSPGISDRVIVAHTDTVGSIDRRCRIQSIKYNAKYDIIYNNSNFRPMGGDDKVGVAAALAIAEFLPHINIWLVSDEEVGCIGSSYLVAQPDLPIMKFGIQLDRRGCNDLVDSIWSDLATKTTSAAALDLLPHRQCVSGMITDIGTLIEGGSIECGFNMSCGYYLPHSSDEYIVLNEAIQSFEDGCVLLTELKDSDLVKVEQKVYSNRYSDPYYNFNPSNYSTPTIGGRYEDVWENYKTEDSDGCYWGDKELKYKFNHALGMSVAETEDEMGVKIFIDLMGNTYPASAGISANYDYNNKDVNVDEDMDSLYEQHIFRTEYKDYRAKNIFDDRDCVFIQPTYDDTILSFNRKLAFRLYLHMNTTIEQITDSIDLCTHTNVDCKQTLICESCTELIHNQSFMYLDKEKVMCTECCYAIGINDATYYSSLLDNSIDPILLNTVGELLELEINGDPTGVSLMESLGINKVN